MADRQRDKHTKLQNIPRENPNIYKENSIVPLFVMFAMMMMMWVTNDTKKSYSDDDDQKLINFLKNTILILNKTCPFITIIIHS